MDYLPQLFETNRRWAAARLSREPDYFERLCALQAPDYLWIGCADSRVPANEIVGLAPGELFVHRNVGNVVPPDDVNCVSVIQYAVEVLKVQHIIVTGHYGCGGIRAALADDPLAEPLDTWISHLRRIRDAHAAELSGCVDEDSRWQRLCEFNVMAQVKSVVSLPVVRECWRRGQPLAVHGWIYDLHDGLLNDLGVTQGGPGMP